MLNNKNILTVVMLHYIFRPEMRARLIKSKAHLTYFLPSKIHKYIISKKELNWLIDSKILKAKGKISISQQTQYRMTKKARHACMDIMKFILENSKQLDTVRPQF